MKFCKHFAYLFALLYQVHFLNGQYYCPTVRYVKIDAGANYLQISQVAIYDSTGVNIAIGKTVTATSVYVGDPCSYYADGPIDGVLTSKKFSDCTQKSYISSTSSSAYWQLDLGTSQTISKVLYYNRLDNPLRATTYSLTLLNSNSIQVCTGSSFTTGLIQNITLIYTGPTSSPTRSPTLEPTVLPSRLPSSKPSSLPTNEPTSLPSRIPTTLPTITPTKEPIIFPTITPTSSPTQTIQTTAMCDLSASLKLISTTWACNNGYPTSPICSGSTTTWTGVTCTSGVVTRINLSGGAFSGTLSSSIGYLTGLNTLWLYTSSLTGTLPTSLGYLSAMTYLYFTSTLITGTVPTQLGYLTKMVYLYLDSTSLTGSIPSEFCALTVASAINVRFSRYSCYATCLSSSTVFVPGTLLPCNNNPTAGPTSSPTRSPSLEPTVLPTRLPSSKPSLIPTNEPTSPPSRIPTSLPTITPTKEPIIFPTITPTSSPTQSIQTTAMCDLSASLKLISTTWACSNGFPTSPICSGSTTTWIGVTCTSGVVTAIRLSNGAFSGTLSSSIGYLTGLNILWLYTSSLTGTLPTSLGYLSSMTYMYFTSTLLTGTVPTELGYLTKMVSLNIDSTSLSGSIPSEFCALTVASAINVRFSRYSCYATCLSSSTVFVPGTLLPCNNNPTAGPTSSPTRSPSLEPTVLPTRLPSSKPSLIPTNEPTSPPSRIPTSLPTITPTKEPIIFPTITPTSSPTQSIQTTAMCDLSASLKLISTTWACSNGYPTSPICSGSTTTWIGVTCTSGVVTAIRLSNGAFSGTLSSSIGYLTGLNILWLYTSSLTGTLPTSLGYLSSMTYMYFTSTLLTGTVPTELGYLTKMVSLNIDSTSLTGSIPSEFCAFQTGTAIDIRLSRFSCYATCLSSFIAFNRGTVPLCSTSTPSSIPSKAPSLIPTTAPTSSLPSALPSIIPTIQPTSFPTVVPTASPSNTPSTIPSAFPTTIPTIIPTTSPTALPTSLPSTKPSIGPTASPTTKPTYLPSRVPTLRPSLQPVTTSPTTTPVPPPTSIPTNKGATNPPTATPSSAPTWNLWDYNTKRIYRYEYYPLINLTSITMVDTKKVFSSFTYKGYVKEGGCVDWKLFTSTSLNLAVASYYFSDITATFGYENFLTIQHTNVTASCSSATIVSGILTAIHSKTITSTYPDYTASCSGNLWRVFTCNSAPVLCVNCSGDCTCPGMSTYLTTSCDSGSSCLSNSASYSHLLFNIKQRVLYPMLTILDIIVDRTAVKIVANISSAGSLYCLGLVTNNTLMSVFQIKQYGSNSVVLDYTRNTTLTLSSLSPSTRYTIYCYTEDANGNGMELSIVKSNSHRITTSCCPTTVFTTTYSSLIEYSTNVTTADSSVFSFSLEKTPTATLTVKLGIHSVVCSNGISYSTTSSNAAAYPSTFVFASGSLVLSGNFVVHGTPGCYEIIASGHGLRNATVSLFIYNTTTVITPTIKSAYFSADGSSVYITFDSSTNYGKTKITNYASGFTCSELLLFTGSSSFTCKWLSNKMIYAYLSTKTTSTPSVGDSVQLLSGVISPSCTGKICTAAAAVASTTSVSIVSPLNPMNPTAALSAPLVVSSCSFIILDPTASIGQGLKDWSTVQWYVSSSDFDTSLIDSFLNTYHNSTMETITIPNSYLTTGSTITFTLYLVNFLGLSSFATATVTISTSSDIPYTTISGPSTVSLYRWQSLSLFVSATVSTCGQSFTNTTTTTSTSALTYSWKVYQGITYQSSLSSTSLNPRFFKLSAYTLDTLSQYTVQVTTTSVATGSFASASVSVNVKQSEIIASISGGAKRVVSTLAPLIVNASTSYDKDTGTTGSDWVYSWSCLLLSPVYGDPCGLTLSSTSAITIPANTLSAKTYNFTVLITSSNTGNTGTASTTIVVLQENLPSLYFGQIKKKYNPEDRIMLTGNVIATATVKSSWSCPGCAINLTSAALTPLHQSFGMGTASIQLALSANTFNSGMTYTLQLMASYTTSNIVTSTYAQVAVLINSPPAQGQLKVKPTQGYNLKTSFYLNTFGWVDDASDYPISYTLTYYSKDMSSTSLIKSIGTVQYTYAYIGQGLSVRNYSVTCVATASDIYGCSDSVNTGLRVLPPASTAILQNSINQQLLLASETSNPDLTVQTSAAATSYLNAASCSAAPHCAALNRSDCDSVTNTCGPCLSGYLGVSGYANSGCQLPSSLRSTGSSCSSGSDCVSNNCQSHICTISLKTCSNNCSGYGTCQYYDSNSNIITSCDANSVFCKAKCTCHANRFGADCSSSLLEYTSSVTMRSDICSQIYAIVDIQDVTADVITGRANLLSSLLLDITQLTADALSNCTLALTTTVLQYPSLCVGDNIYENVITGLSSVLEYGKSTPLSVATQVSSAIDTLLVSRQEILATKEETSIVSTNLRVFSTVSYKSDLNTQSYSLPQSDLETFTHVTPVQVQIGSTATDDSAMVRVSLSQSNINIRNSTTDASIVKLQVHSDITGAITTTKLLLHNIKKLQYFSTGSYNSTVYCTADTTSYYKSANCSEDPSLVVYCPGTTTRTVTAVCPAREYLPQCLSWNGVKYYQDPSCQRVTYSPTNISCECTGSSSTTSRRQLESSSSDVSKEFSASASIQVQAFVSTWSSAADLSASSITQNYYIVMTVCLIMAFFIFGFVGLVFRKKCAKQKDEEESMSQSNEIPNMTLENATAFFDSILPEEFKSRPWYSNFWIKLLECHPHLAYFAPANGRRLYHAKKWLCFCFEILFFIFMDSIFAPLAAADDTTCEVYLTETACETPRSFDMINKLCAWDVEEEICLLNILDNTFTVTIMVVLVASLTSQPLAFLAEYLIDIASGLTEREIEEKEREEDSSEINKKEAMVHATEAQEVEPNKSGKSVKDHRISSVKVAPFIASERNSNNTNNENKNNNYNINQISSVENHDVISDTARNIPDDHYHLTEPKISPNLSLMRVTSYDSIRDVGAIIPIKNTIEGLVSQSRNSSDKEVTQKAVVTRHNQESKKNDNKSTVMTAPSLMMLAARLTLLQQRLDGSDPEEELEWLLRGSEEMYVTDIMADAPMMITLLQSIAGGKSMTTADQRTVEMNKLHSKMLHKISMVRTHTVHIVSELEEMEEDNQKEKYLMKRFLVELKKGVYKKVILRHFFELVEEEEEEAVGRIARAFATIVLILLAVGCLFYILLTGISLGQATTIIWLEALAIGLIQDVFLLKPLGIWFRFIAIASIVSDSVRHVTDLVHDRVPLIMRRTKGVVRHNSLLVQHFNAACRAARAFPHLQTSRLLIALNDYDLPKSLPHKRRILKLFLDMLFLLFVLGVLILTLMPELIQETLIEASMTSVINFPIYALLLLSNLNIALPILVIVLLLLALVAREYFLRRKRVKLLRIQLEKRQKMELFVSNKFQNKL